MKKVQSRWFSSLILVIMIAFLSGVAYSQSDTTKNQQMDKRSTTHSSKYDRDIMNATMKLKSQVDLTMEQTRRVERILQNYKDSNTSTTSGNNMSSENNNQSSGNSNMSSSNNSTLDKIEKVLTSDQKTKFDQIKDQWWSETQSSLSKSPNTDKSKSGY